MQRMAQFTTFGVGGPAGALVEVATAEELIDAVCEADASRQPLFVLSGGSNVLIGDAGFDGTVVRITGGTAGPGWVWAGVGLDDLVAWSIDQGLAGLEALSGIPGLTGAAPVQNVGAYGAEIAQVVQAVRVWDRHERKQITLSPPECGFAYRDSVFKQSRRAGEATGRYVVLSVLFDLPASPLSAPIAYAELAKDLGVELGARVPVRDVRDAVLGLRRRKGMVVDPSDPDTRSAGSFFTNPLLDESAAAGLPPDAPRFPQPDGRTKTSAAWLIEHAGFGKGYGDGAARLSSKHVLALTNRGGATAADIVALARTIRSGVQAKFAVTLEPEPVLVGVEL
ncbi:MAG: UDP-N-acetylmuramate dehydrogenase [Propionibacteriaceae bacterium]|nr:UDP-N-acetylmuramate dehydrogenase [Propionibacteriaceae bacterium]